MNNTKYLNRYIPYVSFMISSLLGYWIILQGFFQQDEWLSFSYNFILQQENIINLLKIVFIPSAGHYQPFNTLLVYLLINIFKLNYLPYALISITLHTVCTCLVFITSKKIFSNPKIPIMIALLFSFSASSFQATSWILADIGIHFATIFALVSIYFYIEFIQNKEQRSFYISLISLIISLLFKEIALGFFLFIPLITFLFFNKTFYKFKKHLFIFTLLGFVYIVLRIIFINSTQIYTQDVTAISSQTKLNLLFNLANFSVVSVIQSIIPVQKLLIVAKSLSMLFPQSISGVSGTTQNDIFIQKNLLEAVSIFLSLSIFGTIVYIYKKDSKSKLIQSALIGFLFIITNAPIFALSPERSGHLIIIDSRDLYLIVFGTSIMIISLFSYFLAKKPKYLLSFISIIYLINLIWLWESLMPFKIQSNTRLEILNTIKSSYPVLPSRVIVYTQSDTSYYGLPDNEKILPFQSGLGQTLLVWYYPTDRLPKEFYLNKYLWGITDQGYKEYDNRGFGYFRDYDLLIKALKTYNLTPENVISYSWNSRSMKFKNITDEVRTKLAGDLNEKSK